MTVLCDSLTVVLAIGCFACSEVGDENRTVMSVFWLYH